MSDRIGCHQLIYCLLAPLIPDLFEPASNDRGVVHGSPLFGFRPQEITRGSSRTIEMPSPGIEIDVGDEAARSGALSKPHAPRRCSTLFAAPVALLPRRPSGDPGV